MPEPEFTPPALAERLKALLEAPDVLTDHAARARSLGRPDAAQRLADVVMAVLNEQAQSAPAPAANKVSVL